MNGEDRDKINYSLLGWVDSLKRKHSKLEYAGWNPATPNLIIIAYESKMYK